MPDENKANKENDEKADGAATMNDATLDKILKGVDSACNAMDSFSKRMDAMEGRMDSFEDMKKESKKDSDEDEDEKAKRVVADKKAKKDSEEKKDSDDDKDKDEKKDSDEDDKKETKSDSVPSGLVKALQDQIDELKKSRTQRSDNDHRSLISAQAKYDQVYQAFGDSAPRFLDGETLGNYRRRLAADLKKHSKQWKAIDVATVADEATFDNIEAQVLSDSMVVAMNPTDIPAGVLREIKQRDKTGREISTFYGRSSDWMKTFSGARRKAKIAPRPTNVTLQ